MTASRAGNAAPSPALPSHSAQAVSLFVRQHRQWLSLAAVLIVLWQAPPLYILKGINLMPLWLHTFFEGFAVVVAMLIFAVGWNNYGLQCPRNILILSCTFLAVGLIDFAHLLAYKGMPDFITPSGPEKGINFWLSARFAAAIGLFSAALGSWQAQATRQFRYFLLLASLGFTAMVYWSVLFHPETWPRTFIDGQGLTPFKIVAEYSIITIMLVPATLFYRQSKQSDRRTAADLFAATAVTILSELCFTLYSDTTDGLNLLGHIYKVIAYFFLYRAIFITTVREPFQRAEKEIAVRKRMEKSLRNSYEEISDLYNKAPCGYHSLDKDGVIVRINDTELDWLGYRREELVGRHFTDLLTPQGVETFTANYPKFKERGLVQTLEYELVRKDGTTLTVMLNATARYDKNGGYLASRSTLHDITRLKLAECAIQEREAMLNAFLASSPFGMLMLDENFRHVRVNPALAEMSGVPVELHLGRTVEEVVPITAPIVMPLYQHVLERGEALRNLEFPSEVPRYPGKLRWWLATYFPILGEGGKPVAVGGMLLDITERKQMEETLKSREATLTQAQQIGRMGSWEWNLTSGTLTWSDELYRLYGLDPRHFQASLELFFQHVPEEEHAEIQRILDLAMEKLSDFEMEHNVIRPDGSLHIHHTKGQVFRNEFGHPVRMVGVEQDITDQRRAEQALRDSEHHMQQLLANLPVCIVIHGADTRIHYSNESAQEFLGLSETQIIGKAAPDPAWRFVREDGSTMPPEEYPVSRVIADRKPVYGCVLGVVRSGWEAPRWAYVHAYPDLDEQGEVRQAVVSFVDISERKNAEQALIAAERQLWTLNENLERRVAQRTRQLEAANRELEAFSYSVSHDLRAPLRSMDGFSQILMRDHAAKLDETGRDYLQRIVRASKRMGELIDDLLQLSRVSRSELKKETIDLSVLARSVQRDIQATAPDRRVEWAIQDGVVVEADSRLMRAMLENLLRNAWKFSAKKADARIEFGAIDREGEEVLFVRDNGAGFDMQYAHKLFGAFQRLHRTEEFEGMGVGLAIVQRIVHHHGGRIWAEGAPGEGATFYFTI